MFEKIFNNKSFPPMNDKKKYNLKVDSREENLVC